MRGHERIEAALRGASGPGLVAYLTGGFPSGDRFLADLDRVASVADVVEIGVPFSDPMADGVTIQRTSRIALEQGASLRKLVTALRRRGPGGPPIVLMGYTNPFLQYGFDRLVADAAEAGIAEFIVPDLPPEEARPLRGPCDELGLALVHLVAPNTSDDRLATITALSTGFVYAVTVTGTTGAALGDSVADTLARVRRHSRVPVCAGFGIRTPADVRRLSPHVDGVIVGTALLEVIERGDDAAAFLSSLKGIS